jgi:hypothetical protein
MALSLKHAFTNPKADGGDATITRPSDWNAEHAIALATQRVVGRNTGGTGAAEEVTATQILDWITSADGSYLTRSGGVWARASIANQRVLGRNTAGSGDPEQVTASQFLDWVASANGALLTRTGGTWAAVGNVTSDSGDLLFAVNASPSAPAAGIKAFGKSIAGRPMLAQIGPAGLDTALQPYIARNRIGMWNPVPGGAATPVAFGLLSPTFVGTATTRNPATTNFATQLRRLGILSAAGAGSVAAARATTAFLWRGNGANLGGFTVVYRFIVSDASLVGTANMFVGISATTGAPTDVAPSTLTNQIGIGCDNGDTVMQLYAAGGSAQARVSLGANFPVNTISTDAYELALFAPPNGSDIKYQVTRLNTGDVASGTISVAANLPSNTTLLTLQMWRSNGGTATAVAIDMIQVYVETDN